MRENAMHHRNSTAYAGCTQAYGGALVVKGAGRKKQFSYEDPYQCVIFSVSIFVLGPSYK